MVSIVIMKKDAASDQIISHPGRPTQSPSADATDVLENLRGPESHSGAVSNWQLVY